MEEIARCANMERTGLMVENKNAVENRKISCLARDFERKMKESPFRLKKMWESSNFTLFQKLQVRREDHRILFLPHDQLNQEWEN